MKYGIIGTGAIGGFYGGKLAKAGQGVHFLLHKDYEYVKQNGLQVDSCDGSFHLDGVNAYNDTTAMPPCDVVLVCLKSINNGMLKTLLPPLLHQRTLVVLRTASAWRRTCNAISPAYSWPPAWLSSVRRRQSRDA